MECRGGKKGIRSIREKEARISAQGSESLLMERTSVSCSIHTAHRDKRPNPGLLSKPGPNIRIDKKEESARSKDMGGKAKSRVSPLTKVSDAAIRSKGHQSWVLNTITGRVMQKKKVGVGGGIG